MTPEFLKHLLPFATMENCAKFAEPLKAAMAEFQIDTLARRSAFLSQVAHESGSLRYTREIWGPTPAQLRYEGNADLGNTQPGDGKRFLGRGLIQITGRGNYAKCASSLALALMSQPELLEQPVYAARSAAWFWSAKKLNELADHNKFGTITKVINGGYNGLDDRLGHWLTARKGLGL